MKATARWPRVARENAITALRCAVASWFALWWLNVGIGGRRTSRTICRSASSPSRLLCSAATRIPSALGYSSAPSWESRGHRRVLGSFRTPTRLSAALAAFEDFRVELSTNPADAWDAYYDGAVQGKL